MMRHKRWKQYSSELAVYRNHCRELPVEAVDWPKVIDTEVFEGNLKDFALAKLLCVGKARVPHHIIEYLADTQLPCGISIEQAWEMSWREVRIPLYLQNGQPGIMYAELGIGDPDSLNNAEPIILQDGLEGEMLRALQCSLGLARKKTGMHYALWLRDAGGQFRRGPSLALPVYLAAVLPLEVNLCSVLATGDIDAEGHLHQVGGIKEKGHLMSEESINIDFGFTHFVFPTCQDGISPGQVGFFCIDSLEQAEYLVTSRIDSPMLWGDIRRLALYPLSFWQSIRHDMTYREARIFLERAISYGIFSDASTFNSEELEYLCNFLNRYDLVDDIRPYFYPEHTENHPPSLGLYRMARAFRKNASRRGDGHAFEQWCGIIDRCNDFVQHSSVAWLELQLEHIERMVGDLHNVYRFEAGEEKVARLYDDLVACESSPLAKGEYPSLVFGKCWGFIGQHRAFCGETTQARKHFQRSFETFSPSDIANKSFACCNSAYAAWDAGDGMAASDAVRGAEKLLAKDDDIYQQQESFLLALLARESFETGVISDKLGTMLAPLINEFSEYYARRYGTRRAENVPEKTSGGRAFTHPWQLFFLNIGRLQAQDVDSTRCLWLAYHLCTHESGEEVIPCRPLHSETSFPETDLTPLIPMALLPLSQLPEDDIVLSRTREVLRLVRVACDGEKLHKPHFANLLESSDASSALHVIRRDMKRLFPFNYR